MRQYAGNEALISVNRRQWAFIAGHGRNFSIREAKSQVVDIRVDDHSEPLTELGRLLEMHDAYSNLEKYRHDPSIESELSSEIPEIAFWLSIDLANNGRHEEARELAMIPLQEHPGWKQLLIRCSRNGLAGISKETVGILLDVHPESN